MGQVQASAKEQQAAAKVDKLLAKFDERFKDNPVFRNPEFQKRAAKALNGVERAISELNPGMLSEKLNAIAKEVEQFEAERENVKYSISRNTGKPYYKIPFADGLKRVVDPAQKENRSPVFVAETPEVLRKIGFTALPMLMNARHLRLNYYTQAEFEANYGKMRTQEHAHGLHDKLQSLPKALEYPLAVVANLTRNAKPGSVVAITDMNINGKKVVVPVLIETESTGDGERIDSHLVLTVYDSDDWVNDFLVPALEEEKNGIGVFYFDKEKANRYSALSQKEGSIPTGFVHNISQTGIKVKPQIKTFQFKKWFKKSKIVNADGEPLVVYHDTNSKIYVNKDTGENWDDLAWEARDAWKQREDWDKYWKEQDFYTFSRKRARRSIEYPGFFFTPNADPYHEYGKRRIAAYLSIQNPAVNPKIDNAGVTDDAGAAAMQKLIDEGYDGIIRKDDNGNIEEIIAFYPEQIKSATDNIGTFDPKNPDIRYSLTPTASAEAKEDVTDGVKYSIAGPEYVKDLKPLPQKFYKVHRIVGGKAYPAMVKNPSGLDTPFGVPLKADTGTIRTDADGNPETNTNGRLKTEQNLAWRPGNHLGLWPDAKQFLRWSTPERHQQYLEWNRNHPGEDNPYKADVFPKDLVFVECTVYGNKDYQVEAMEYGVNENGKFNRTQAGLPYIPHKGYYLYRTNANPDTSPFVIADVYSNDRVLTDAEVKEILDKQGIAMPSRIGGELTADKLIEMGLTPGMQNAPAEIDPRMYEGRDESAKVAALPGYVRRPLDFNDPNVQKEFQINGLNPEQYRNAGAKYSLNGPYLKELEKVNTVFNREIDRQFSGNLKPGHLYQLGHPSPILLSTGIPDLPIELSSTRLAEKAGAAHHPFDITDIKDLPMMLQDPVGVFSYGDKNKAQNVLVEIQRNGKNFIVGLSLNYEHNGITVNSIRGLFPKDTHEWLTWIQNGKALYLDKEKIQSIIDQQRRNLADVEYINLDSISNIIKNFKNTNYDADEKSKNPQTFHYSLNGRTYNALNINDDPQNFSRQILAGEKTVETRNYGNLAHQGEEVILYRTGKNGIREPYAIAVLGEPVKYADRAAFDADYERHRIGPDSPFYPRNGEVKYGYPLSGVRDIRGESPKEIGAGRVFRKVQYSFNTQPRQQVNPIREDGETQAEYQERLNENRRGTVGNNRRLLQ